MKSTLSTFCPAIEFNSCRDAVSYLVDYSKSQDKLKGVALNCVETDLAGLKLHNHQMMIPVSAAIFNDHCFKKEDATKDEEHCEAVLFPEPFEKGNWLLFVELKYGNRPNRIVQKAYNQVLNTIRSFRQSKLIEVDKVVHGLVCFPESYRKPPYESSIYSFEELRMFKKKDKVILVSTNEVTIYSTTKLSVR
jgi:hypothetical protein